MSQHNEAPERIEFPGGYYQVEPGDPKYSLRVVTDNGSNGLPIIYKYIFDDIAAAMQPASVPVPVGRSAEVKAIMGYIEENADNGYGTELSREETRHLANYIARLEARPAVQPSHVLDEELSSALNLAEMYQSGAFGEEKERSLLAKALLHVWALYDVPPSRSADYCNIAVLLAETARKLRDKPYEDVAEAFEKVLVRAFADAQQPAPVVRQSDEECARKIGQTENVIFIGADSPDGPGEVFQRVAALIAAHRKADGEVLLKENRLLHELVKLYEHDLKDVHLLVVRDLIHFKGMVRITMAASAKIKKKLAALSQPAKGER